MKVFILGGYGVAGKDVARLLVKEALISQIAITGRDLAKAETFAEEMGPKAIALAADVFDEDKLCAQVTGYDIIINAANAKASLPALRVAIKNSIHYCDMEYGETYENAKKLFPAAKKAGITAILGNGIEPNISNLLAIHLSRQFDEIEQLQMGDLALFQFGNGLEITPTQWLNDAKKSLKYLNDFKGFMIWLLSMVEANGAKSLRVFQDRQWQDRDPVRDGIEIPVPSGDWVKAYPYASLDTIFGEVPSGLAKKPPVHLFFSPFPAQLEKLHHDLALQVQDQELDHQAAISAFFDEISKDPEYWLKIHQEQADRSRLWIQASGRIDGKAARGAVWLLPETWATSGWFLTSVSLVITVLKVLRGEFKQHGVFHGESTFEPHEVFDDIVKLIPDKFPNGKLIGESFEWLE